MAQTTAHSQIVAWFVSTLVNAPALAGVAVSRGRVKSLGAATSKAVAVRKLDSRASEAPFLGHGTDWTTVVRVDAVAAGAASQATDAACDELMLTVHQVLSAAIAADPTLGGLAMATDPPQLGWDEADEFDSPLGAAVAQYPVRHRTAPNSLLPAT